MRYLIPLLFLAGCSHHHDAEKKPEPQMGPALPAVIVQPVMPVANG